MSSTNTDQTIVLDTGSDEIYAVAFHPDGEHLLGGIKDGIQRWRLSDGHWQEVAKQTGERVFAISVSRDGKWIACGTTQGASVWDGEMQEKVIDVEETNRVWAVDISPDSTRFATGSAYANIWSIETGERLVGPLKHVHSVSGVQFSPNGEYIAAACYHRSIRVFDSHNGDELITINIIIPKLIGITPLAWSSDGRQIFATSGDKKIKSFDVSTGSQLAELQIPCDGYGIYSLALAPNGKFIATFGTRSIMFVDTLTLSWTGPVIEVSEGTQSIAISRDSSHLATGRVDGKIVIHHLNGVLADSYGPFHVSTREEPQQDERRHNSKEGPGKPSHCESEGDGDLLDEEVRSDMPVDEFDYGEISDPSLASVLTPPEAPSQASPSDPRGGGAPPLGPSPAISQLHALPAPSTTETRREENLESSKGIRVVKRWLQTRFGKSNKDPVLHKLGRLSRKSCEPADLRSPSHSPGRVDDKHEGPSRMAPARSKITKRPMTKSRGRTTTPKHPNEDASRSGQGAADANEVDPTQQATCPSQPSPAGVRVSHQEVSGYGTLRFSIRYPMWLLCCCRSGTHDETH